MLAPGEEPRFFDDVGCLRDFLAARPARPAREVAYVADHRTKAWVRARAAVYARVPGLEIVARDSPDPKSRRIEVFTA